MYILSRDFDILKNGQQIRQEYARKNCLLYKVLLNLHTFSYTEQKQYLAVS